MYPSIRDNMVSSQGLIYGRMNGCAGCGGVFPSINQYVYGIFSRLVSGAAVQEYVAAHNRRLNTELNLYAEIERGTPADTWPAGKGSMTPWGWSPIERVWA